MAIILRYFSKFELHPGALRKSSRSLSHLLMSSCTKSARVSLSDVTCSSLNLERKSVDSITWIAWSVDCVHNTVQLSHCEILNFLFSELQPPTAWSQSYNILSLMAVWICFAIASHQVWRNQTATGCISETVMQHLSEKMQSWCLRVLWGSAEALVRRGGKKHVLIACFLSKVLRVCQK